MFSAVGLGCHLAGIEKHGQTKFRMRDLSSPQNVSSSCSGTSETGFNQRSQVEIQIGKRKNVTSYGLQVFVFDHDITETKVATKAQNVSQVLVAQCIGAPFEVSEHKANSPTIWSIQHSHVALHF